MPKNRVRRALFRVGWEARLRLGQFAAEEVTPLEALGKYLETKKFSPAHAKLLLEYGERLIQEQRTK